MNAEIPAETPAGRHRRIAANFDRLVAGTADWDAPTPVEGWSARDVVGHLAEWLPGFLSGGTDVALPAGPGAAEDPAGAWTTLRDGVQALLDGPDAAAAYRSKMLGDMPLAEAVNRFYTTDVLMHAWDLAKATGQDPGLDPAECEAMHRGMRQMEDVIRSSGQFGEQQPVPPGATPVEELIAFIGRDPTWAPPG